MLHSSSSCNYVLDNGHLEDQMAHFDLLLETMLGSNASHYKSSSFDYITTMPRLKQISNGCPSLKGAAPNVEFTAVVEDKKRECLNDEKVKTQGGKKKRKSKVSDSEGDCVYVRARNGEATDSHSLAERVRRQKIRDRMKLLQSLVPGCDKMVGKTLILDEIINYIHSLQSQVEFLMAKLASVGPGLCADYLPVDFVSTPKEKSSLEYSAYECDQDEQASLYRMCASSSPSVLTSAWLASLNDHDYYKI